MLALSPRTKLYAGSRNLSARRKNASKSLTPMTPTYGSRATPNGQGGARAERKLAWCREQGKRTHVGVFPKPPTQQPARWPAAPQALLCSHLSPRTSRRESTRTNLEPEPTRYSSEALIRSSQAPKLYFSTDHDSPAVLEAPLAVPTKPAAQSTLHSSP